MKKLLFFSVLMGLVSCKEKFLLYEKNELKGTLVLRDEFSESPDVVAPKTTTLSLAYDNDTQNYLYRAKVEDDGSFNLLYQPTDKDKLVLLGQYTNPTDKVYYEGSRYLRSLAQVIDPVLELKAQYVKKILKVKVTGNSEPVLGAKVYLFTNQKQAEAAVAAKDIEPTGALNATTNARGIAFFHRLDPAPDKFYVLAKSTTGKETLFTSVVEAQITDAAVHTSPPAPQELRLIYPSAPITNNGIITITVKTSPAVSPQGLKVYLFSTQAEAKSVESGVIVGHQKEGLIGMTGVFVFEGLNYGKYYLGLSGTLPTGTRVAAVSGEISVQSSQSVSYSFEVK